jgi:hypothetical protein
VILCSKINRLVMDGIEIISRVTSNMPRTFFGVDPKEHASELVSRCISLSWTGFFAAVSSFLCRVCSH